MAIILGILQGITEWLPISSSGHLAIFQFYFEEEPPILFDIILHIGSLCVIKRVLDSVPSFFSNYRNYTNLKGEQRLIGLVIVASIPTAIIGFTFDSTVIGDIYSEMHLDGGCMNFTGILVWLQSLHQRDL